MLSRNDTKLHNLVGRHIYLNAYLIIGYSVVIVWHYICTDNIINKIIQLTNQTII